MEVDLKFLKQLRWLSLIEGVSTLLLFGVAMPLKYAAGMPMAVTIVGSLHGVLFMALVWMFMMAVQRVPIPTKLAVAGVVGAIIPFGPFLMEPRLKRVGQSSQSENAAA